MTKDKELEDLFLAQKPHFDDSAEFMEKLTKRLEAVEFVKQYQERTLRRYKMAMVAVFVVGIISGGISTWWLLSTPANEPLFNFNVQTSFLVWLVQNSRLLAATGLSLLMTLGVCVVISNILEIMDMRQSMEEKRGWLVM
ncbi:MAG: hypothetical protein IKU02_04140 [Bacteroidaceae bacterium]|nr:hypothetical protein [Bacteroidaceae bacterium]